MFLKCCTGNEKVAPTDYDKIEDIRSTPYKKEKLTLKTDLREDPDEHEEVTWLANVIVATRQTVFLCVHNK